MPTKNEKPSALIEELVRHWACWDEHEVFYLTKLAPSLVANPESGDDIEQAILRKLRGFLNNQEWLELPALISEKRSGILREIESERLRREALEKERQEAERIAAQKKEDEARERIRQEQLRKQAEAQRNAILQELRSRLQSDYLGIDAFFKDSCTGLITEQEFEAEQLAFGRARCCRWFCRNGSIVSNSQNGRIQTWHRYGWGR